MNPFELKEQPHVDDMTFLPIFVWNHHELYLKIHKNHKNNVLAEKGNHLCNGLTTFMHHHGAYCTGESHTYRIDGHPGVQGIHGSKEWKLLADAPEKGW